MVEVADTGPLAVQVRGLLDSILRQSDFPGAAELRGQTPAVSVLDGPVTMLDLRVSAGTAARDLVNGPIPASATVLTAKGEMVGELLVWVENGYLSALEFAWWTDDPPDRLPDPSNVRVDQT